MREPWPADVPVGVIVPNDVDIETSRPTCRAWRWSRCSFPKWVDGRAYSQARLLRIALPLPGEIRATGEVLVDMLPLLARTGFDAALLRADQSRRSARRALGFFAGHYQGDVHETRPRFARPRHDGRRRQRPAASSSSVPAPARPT